MVLKGRREDNVCEWAGLFLCCTCGTQCDDGICAEGGSLPSGACLTAQLQSGLWGGETAGVVEEEEQQQEGRWELMC